MRPVAAQAHSPGHRHMRVLLAEFCLTMTRKTEVRNLGRKSLADFIRHLMGNILCIYRGMAGRATHLDSSMHGLPFCQLFVTDEAVALFRGNSDGK